MAANGNTRENPQIKTELTNTKSSILQVLEPGQSKVSSRPGYIAPNNFQRFNWQALHSITLEDIHQDVKDQYLQRSQETLNVLELKGLTNFRNLKHLLRWCGDNLQSLIFSDILMLKDRSAPEPADLLPIDLPRLRYLTLYGCGPFSIHELYVVKFLGEWVNVGGDLTTVSVKRRKCRSRGLRGSSIHSGMGNSNEDQVSKGSWEDSNKSSISWTSNLSAHSDVIESDYLKRYPLAPIAFARLLYENRRSLKNLVMDRGRITVFDENDLQSDEWDVELERLECDLSCSGIHSILRAQKSLRTFVCFNSTVGNHDPEQMWQVIRRCAETLETVSIQYNSKGPGLGSAQVIPEDPSMFFCHNFDCYKDCVNLQELNVLMTTQHNPPYPESFQVIPTALINLVAIPYENLDILTLRFDYVHESELEEFARESFPKFEKLRFLVFHGNPQYPYRLKIGWALSLLALPGLRHFQFKACSFADDLDLWEALARTLQVEEGPPAGKRTEEADAEEGEEELKALEVTVDSCTYAAGTRKTRKKNDQRN